MRRLIALLLGYTSRLRFPWLAAITACLFLLDVAIPDMIPFADEVLLGLLTALFASWRRTRVNGDGEGGVERVKGSDAPGEEPGAAP
ncbi:MAG: hypothetical protein QNK05_22510 [Myxococcota bacterium]|nr:hypothetical protein [Myxococcota bacterium]